VANKNYCLAKALITCWSSSLKGLASNRLLNSITPADKETEKTGKDLNRMYHSLSYLDYNNQNYRGHDMRSDELVTNTFS
jgi:hypothetical protein